MSRFNEARTAQFETGASRSVAGRQAARILLVAIGAAGLAACALSPVGRLNSELSGAMRHAAVARHPEVRPAAATHVRASSAPSARATERALASGGVASFYSNDQETASGEKFDRNQLTAAHPSLPFGTRLRVTNVSTGRSVTVRVNDRGPYVRGRVVDVSYSAAEALGMVNAGLANVKLDVVQ
jgi:rare lipoprotein A